MMKTKWNLLSLKLFALGLFVSAPAFANFHEVRLHSTEAAISFGDGTGVDLEGNYAKYINKDWQIEGGLSYQKNGDRSTRTGLSLGGVYNFGALDHNEKYFIRPQLNHLSIDEGGASESAIFISGVFGRRFPLFKSDQYTLNYIPSVGLSIPMSNTDVFDTVFTVSIVGLSLVFK